MSFSKKTKTKTNQNNNNKKIDGHIVLQTEKKKKKGSLLIFPVFFSGGKFVLITFLSTI